MEYCNGGDLSTIFTSSSRCCSEQEVAVIIEQLLSAVAYLHDRNIVHRDLKLENILFVGGDRQKNLDIKVIDFGLAKKYLLQSDRHDEKCGTLYTMSPEVMQRNCSGSSTDLWSIGVIAYMLLSNGEKPFWGTNRKMIEEEVCTKDVTFEGPVWENISSDAKNFILTLLRKNPEERPTAKEATKHTFIRNRKKLPKQVPSDKLLCDVPINMVRYADCSDFKRIAMQVIASRSSSDEIFELRRVFAQYDKNMDGSLTFEEFKECLSQFNYTEKEVESIFLRVEVNRTGRILYTEFLASTLEAQGKIAQNKISEAFHELDRESKGYINKEDLRNIMPAATSDKEMNNLMLDVSTNAKGYIFLDKFKRAVRDENNKKVSRLYDSKTKSHGFLQKLRFIS